jgi:hypothetical protein
MPVVASQYCKWHWMTASLYLGQPPGRAFASTHPSARAAPARIYIVRPRAAVPRRLWAHRATLPAATASAVGRRLPSRNATQSRHLAETHHPLHRRITVRTGGLHAPSCLVTVLADNKLTKPSHNTRSVGSPSAPEAYGSTSNDHAQRRGRQHLKPLAEPTSCNVPLAPRPLQGVIGPTGGKLR